MNPTTPCLQRHTLSDPEKLKAIFGGLALAGASVVSGPADVSTSWEQFVKLNFNLDCSDLSDEEWTTLRRALHDSLKHVAGIYCVDEDFMCVMTDYL